ncbi:(2Fe-2S)-binding protein [Azospirillum picis]|uniref:succinate dehydrogenase n=1 Tax=Azospirillum picis TaxID=488438 RepID=A0ABU0MVA7_9PROT|nr:(2Fe-2S)-binding protein [Azospirillum picis]MBP2303577.1 2-furoyl-CoA dehydrogenase 2Fe-2S iron sulfur subunit [Azospirillum picis]MDQ0537425.1 2-furoyl-CoA dehydrogenase 2Fe-2S iron sulfur subunit [Azospirillum picis]
MPPLSSSPPPAPLAAEARHPVTIVLNGRRRSGHAHPRLLLSDFLRHELGAHGTHVGCEHGVCGACTVRIDGVASRACLTLAVQADGRRIDTVEGLADGNGGRMTALQEAFRRHHALQCGFCTAGILMSLSDYLDRNPKPTEEELRDMLSGHLCRCTGYAGIVRAVMDVTGGTAASQAHQPAEADHV